MSKIGINELNHSTNTFLNYMMNLLLDNSDDIFEILVLKSNETIFKSDWKDKDAILNLIEIWNNTDIPGTFTYNGLKFIKLHSSPFNLIYRSIKEQMAILGIKFQVQSEEIKLLTLMNQNSNMQSVLVYFKDIIVSILELGKIMTNIKVIEPLKIHIIINFYKNKEIIMNFIESLKEMQFECNYTDKGDSIYLDFKFKKKDNIRYPDYMYK